MSLKEEVVLELVSLLCREFTLRLLFPPSKSVYTLSLNGKNKEASVQCILQGCLLDPGPFDQLLLLKGKVTEYTMADSLVIGIIFVGQSLCHPLPKV